MFNKLITMTILFTFYVLLFSDNDSFEQRRKEELINIFGNDEIVEKIINNMDVNHRENVLIKTAKFLNKQRVRIKETYK